MFDLLKAINEPLFSLVYDECKGFEERLSKDEDLKILYDALMENNPLYSHSLSVAYLSLMFATHQKIESEVIRYVMFTTAMFHDIGKTKIDRVVQEKDLLDLTYDEKKELEKHSEIGAELVSALKRINGEIPEVICQHHEYANGMGYPKGIHNTNIHPHAKHLIICNEYIQLFEKFHNDHERAYKVLCSTKSELFDTLSFDAFKAMFPTEG